MAHTQLIIDISWDKRLKQLWHDVNSFELPDTAPECEIKSEINTSDAQRTVDNGIALGESHTTKVTAVAKVTVEETKTRRRFLVWPKLFNESFKYKADVPLKCPIEVIEEVAACHASSSIARVFDIKCAFFAHEVSSRHSAWLVFMVDGKKYTMARLPMGSTVSPEIQQRISQTLVELAFEVAGIKPSQNELVVTIHIDNFRFYGDKRMVDKIAEAFITVCEAFELILVESKPETFLGMEFDYVNCSVKVAQKTLDKISASTLAEEMTVEDLLSLFGRIFFCTEVQEISLSHYFYALKFYRHVSRNWEKMGRNKMTVWKATREDINDLVERILINEPRQCGTQREVLVEVWTDASDVGFACIFNIKGQVLIYARSWKEERFWNDENWLPSINQRESFAVTVAKRKLENMGIQKGEAVLFLDSSAAASAHAKGYSPSFWLNKTLSNHEKNWWRAINLISTHGNWADHASRNPWLYAWRMKK